MQIFEDKILTLLGGIWTPHKSYPSLGKIYSPERTFLYNILPIIFLVFQFSKHLSYTKKQIYKSHVVNLVCKAVFNLYL